MEAPHITALVEAVETMAEQLNGIDVGDVFGGFTCSELDSIARVLKIAGHAGTAAFIVMRHAESDEFPDDGDLTDWDGDMHAPVALAHSQSDGPSLDGPAMQASKRYVSQL
ncbi:hypothetical protein [Actinoplanes sp. NPDC049265]|uniref:hypothetical protein n=1 Tax=Actinoplanes sp. NPDC049265 TaxID=3363902 RepID=UPI003720AA97